MGKVGCRCLAGGVLLTGLLGTVPALAMPLDRGPAAADSGAVVRAQFIAGPFYGRYGYREPDPSKRFYFYEGFDPSLYPPKAGGTWHYSAHRKHRRRHF